MTPTYEQLLAKAQAAVDRSNYREAVKHFRAARRLDASDPKITHALAIALHEMARGPQAEALYVKLRGGEYHPSAALAMSQFRPEAMTSSDEAILLQTARTETIGAEYRTGACMALGRMWDAQGRLDDAFAAFRDGNDLMAKTFDLDRLAAQEDLEIARIERAFSEAFVKRWQGRGHESAAPIFVVGRPRSGTTLIEQILATHPKVQGMREPMALSHAIETRVYWPPQMDSPPEYFRELGEVYLRMIRQAGWRRKPRFVDKFPMNYFYIGVIALAFPNAVILHTVRDPMDAGLSWYQRQYDRGNEFSYDLRHIGLSYRRYRRIMDHWGKVLPGRVTDVVYEDLVASPEQQIRWLITEACGLEWEDVCLRFYENDRLVRTPSKFQVRQPIFTSAVGRWRHYQPYLTPLIDALGPHGPARQAA